MRLTRQQAEGIIGQPPANPSQAQIDPRHGQASPLPGQPAQEWGPPQYGQEPSQQQYGQQPNQQQYGQQQYGAEIGRLRHSAEWPGGISDRSGITRPLRGNR